jgi:hypothetical protein
MSEIKAIAKLIKQYVVRKPEVIGIICHEFLVCYEVKLIFSHF